MWACSRRLETIAFRSTVANLDRTAVGGPRRFLSFSFCTKFQSDISPPAALSNQRLLAIVHGRSSPSSFRLYRLRDVRETPQ